MSARNSPEPFDEQRISFAWKVLQYTGLPTKTERISYPNRIGVLAYRTIRLALGGEDTE